MAQSDKDFLIRVRADIRQALTELKKLGGDITGAGNAAKTTSSDLKKVTGDIAGAGKAAGATSGSLKKVTGDIAGAGNAAKTASGKIKSVGGDLASTGDRAKKSGEKIGTMERSINRLKSAAVGYLSLRFAQQIVLQADAFNVLQVRIRTATKATGDYEKVSRELYATSQANGVALSTTVSLFQNLARAAPELGATTDETLALTKAVQQLGVISGTSKANLDAGLLQFSQAMASGVVRAEELNSLLENIPEVAARIAKGMGLSTGELRKQVLEGKVLSQDVFNSLLKQTGEINREFAEIPDSVGRTGTALSDSFSRFLSQLDQASRGTGALATVMRGITHSLDNWSDRLAEDELGEAMRRRTELAHKLYEEQKRNSALNWAIVGRIKKEIDLVDAKIIELNKKRLKSEDSAGGNNNKPTAPTETPEEKTARERIEKNIEALELEARLYGATAREAALYKLEIMGASAAQLQKADAALQAIAADEDFAAAVEASEQAVRDENAAYQEWLDTLSKSGDKVYADTRTDMEQLALSLDDLDVLLNAGKISWDTYARAVFDASDKFDEVESAGVSAMDQLTAATKGWGDAFTNQLADMVRQGKYDFADLADSILQDLLRIAIYQTITKPALGALGIPGFADGGYVSGPGSGTSDSINARLSNGEFVQPTRAVEYYGANFMESVRRLQLPKFASGGMVGTIRRPAVARFAEGGLVAGQGQGSGSVRVEFENKGSPKQVESANARMDPDGLVISIVSKDLGRDGPIAQSIAQNFNVSRRV